MNTPNDEATVMLVDEMSPSGDASDPRRLSGRDEWNGWKTLAIVMSAFATAGIVLLLLVMGAKSLVISERDQLKSELEAAKQAKAPAPQPPLAAIVPLPPKPEKSAIPADKLRIVVAATYAYDDPLMTIKQAGVSLTQLCRARFANLTSRVVDAKTPNGTNRVLIVDREGGMDEATAKEVAECVKDRIVGAGEPMVRSPKTYRKGSL